MRIPRPRLGLRTLLELVALVAAALGFRNLWLEIRPPGPSVRALRQGNEADRVAALRSLSLAGEVGVAAIPALIAAARDDPSPAVRRGAIHALTAITLVHGERDQALDAVLAGPPTPGPTPPRPGRRRTPPFLRTRADEVAMGLADVLRVDPDPSVRVYALRALRTILNAALVERQQAKAPAAPGQPAPARVSDGPWVEAAARAAAEAAGDPDPEVRGHAVGFLLGSSAGSKALTAGEQLAALRPLVEVDPPRLPLGLDILALDRIAQLLGPDHPDAPRLIDLLLGRRADPPLDGEPADRRAVVAEQARGAYARILWHLVASSDTLRSRPELAEILIPMLSGDRRTYQQVAHRGSGLPFQYQSMLADESRSRPTGGGSASYSGLVQLPAPRDAAAGAIGRDPRLLGVIWPRLDRVGRLRWLIGEENPWRDPWAAMLPLLTGRRDRPDLPPEESAAILGRLLDEPEPSADDANLRDALMDSIRLRRRVANPDRITPALIEEARQELIGRNLAILAYFARGARPDAEPVRRLVDRLRGRLAASEPSVRAGAAELLGSLGDAAAGATLELGMMARGDTDEVARAMAAEALETLRETRDGDD